MVMHQDRDSSHAISNTISFSFSKHCTISSKADVTPLLHATGPLAFKYLPSRANKRRVCFTAPFASISQSMSGTTTSAVPLLVKTKPIDDSSKSQSELYDDARVLISEIDVEGVEGELLDVVKSTLRVKPNYAYTAKEVQAELQNVFRTGWFANIAPETEDTRDGIKLTVKVVPNPEVRTITAHGANILPDTVLEEAFRDVNGKTLNFQSFGRAVKTVDRWYQERGILGKVVDFSFNDGVAELHIGEVRVGNIKLNFIDQKTGESKTKGATKPEIIQRHLSVRPGTVYNLKDAQRDISAVYSTGVFEDVNISPEEAEDSTVENPMVDLTLNLVERKTGGLGAGTGISAAAHGEGSMPGFVGSLTFSERNLFGMNQRLTAQVEIGQIEKVFKIQHTDPWIFGDPYRTSRTVLIEQNRSVGSSIHGRPDTTPTPENASTSPVNLAKQLASIEWQRPLKGVEGGITGSLGFSFDRTRCVDEHGRSLTHDTLGGALTKSGEEFDHCVMASTSLNWSPPDRKIHGSIHADQAIAFHPSWVNFTRLRARVDAPMSLGPCMFYFRGRGGCMLNDVPPYEAFPIGGTNSVRGYSEGGVGSGRHFLEATSELRWNMFGPFQGVVFADYGTDFNSGQTVIGDPAGVRGKPGSGFGYGLGVRADTPMGPLRLEYAFNEKRVGRFHVGLG